MIEVGSGQPLVLIPGIQGRWEYLQPAIDALAKSFRVLSFPLAGEPGAGVAFDAALGLDNYVRQVVTTLDRSGLEDAVICGISFGGLVAIRFAAAHPNRTAALILVSTPGPQWQLRPRHRIYARLPWLFGPLFLIETPFRLRAELGTAFPDKTERRHFSRSQLQTLVRAPLSPVRMAARAAFIPGARLLDACARITAPTLVVTGESGLDRVVPVDATLTYLTRLPNACHATLASTGHLGSITRPDTFASLVRDFVERSSEKGRAHATA